MARCQTQGIYHAGSIIPSPRQTQQADIILICRRINFWAFTLHFPQAPQHLEHLFEPRFPCSSLQDQEPSLICQWRTLSCNPPTFHHLGIHLPTVDVNSTKEKRLKLYNMDVHIKSWESERLKWLWNEILQI